MRFQLWRTFAWNAKWKQKPPRRKDKRRTPDQIYMEKLKEQAIRREKKRQKKAAQNRAKQGVLTLDPNDSGTEADLSPDDDEAATEAAAATTTTPNKKFVPPALLLPTGSPYVYVSKLAAQESDIDPRDLFPPAEMENIPLFFRQNTFVYDGVERLNDNNNNKTNNRPGNIAQVAFLGRSNVGKSSLVNALMRRDLARCSKHPGRTQQVHRFALVSSGGGARSDNSKQPEIPAGMFLDLPGYGYAVAPDAALDDWQRRTQLILKREFRQGTLRRIFLLIDARTGVTEIDQNVLTWLDETGGGIPHTLVWTKSDAVAKHKLIKEINQSYMWYQQRNFLHEQEEGPLCSMSPVVHTTSAKGAGQGLIELLSAIEAEFLAADGQ